MNIKTSEQTDKLWPALLAARREIRTLVKSANNPHFNSDFADLNEIQDATEGPLDEHGLMVMQGPGITPEGFVTVETRILHVPSGQWVSAIAGSQSQKSDPQGYGSGITYLRRYGLKALLNLREQDDDGNAASSPPPKRRSAPAPSRRPASRGGGGDPSRSHDYANMKNNELIRESGLSWGEVFKAVGLERGADRTEEDWQACREYMIAVLTGDVEA